MRPQNTCRRNTLLAGRRQAAFFGIGNRRLRQSALDLIEATELNALVIDVKGDRGMIAYPSAIPLAAQVGAQTSRQREVAMRTGYVMASRSCCSIARR